MAVAAFVVERRAALHELDKLGAIKWLGAGGDRGQHFLGQVQCRAPVAVGHAFQGFAGVHIQRQRPALFLFGPLEEVFQGLFAEAIEGQHRGARKKRGVEFEGRVLGRGTDERDRAVLHVGKKAVLLRAVETMDFVDEQQRALALLAQGLGAIE